MDIVVPEDGEHIDDVVRFIKEAFYDQWNHGPEEVWLPECRGWLMDQTSPGIPKGQEIDRDIWESELYPQCALHLMDEEELAGFIIYYQYADYVSQIEMARMSLEASLQFQRKGAVKKELSDTISKQVFRDISSWYSYNIEPFDVTITAPEESHSITRIDQDDYYISYIVIDEAHRGKGYGSLLLQELCNRLASKGVERMFSHTDNPASLRIHEKAGFEQLLYITPFYENFSGTTFMGCDLTEVIRDE